MQTNLSVRLLPFLALLLAVPTAWAHAVAPTDVVIADEGGHQLRYIPRDDLVKLQVTLNNTGTTRLNDTLTVRLKIVFEDGTTVFNQTIKKAVDLRPGNSTVLSVNWPPAGRKLGNHTLTATVDGSSAPALTATFAVKTTAVVAGSYVERIARYAWFFGAFVLAIILFAVVLAARRA
jgi:hypothetical protein